MSTAVWTNQVEPNSVADKALKAAAGLWFLVAIGQWAFLYYIVAFYGRSTFTGNFQVWNRNTFLNMAYVPGVTAGSLTFAAHMLLAAVIAFGGAMQLIPQLGSRHSVHRWIGRVFFVTALGLSGSGLYMEWVRGDRFNMVGAVAISLNAVLIILRRPVHLLLGFRLLPCASCRSAMAIRRGGWSLCAHGSHERRNIRLHHAHVAVLSRGSR